jgi:hypothetical protein
MRDVSRAKPSHEAAALLMAPEEGSTAAAVVPMPEIEHSAAGETLARSAAGPTREDSPTTVNSRTNLTIRCLMFRLLLLTEAER